MSACRKALILSAGLTLFWAGFVKALCPTGDLNGDCQVNGEDLLILGQQWLAPPESLADLDGDDRVDLNDFGWIAADWRHPGVPLYINEIQAANAAFRVDPQGEYDDWIEIYNAGPEPVDLGGMYLTDDPENPRKWRVPADDPSHTTVPGDGYLVIWTDGDIADQGLHAGFALDADGDTVALFDRDGATLIDYAEFGEQEADVSYGRLPDGTDTWQPLASPTPGAQNIAVYEGFVAAPTFSPERGFCEGEVLVTIRTDTEGATIWYTTDGTEPYLKTGRFPTGRIYEGPLHLTGTACLRAKAIKPGWRASAVRTHTYIFVDDVIRQSASGQVPGPGWPSGSVNGQTINYGMDPDVVNDPRYRDLMDDALLSIPSISLVTELGNLFDAQSGIYAHAGSEGRAWERPVSVELLNPDESEGFQIDAGMRIRGGFSRSNSNPKHAFRLFFRPEYGRSKLKFPLFVDEGTDAFENVDLRTSQNYSWSFQNDRQNTMVREVFSRDVQGETGHPYTRSRYYHLYINGHYWGLFQTQERSEASYAESYFGGNKEDYDVVKCDRSVGRAMLATDGNMDAYRRLYDATTVGFGDDDRYYRAQGLNPDGTPNPGYERLLDVENLIDFMIVEYYTGDRDGPGSRFGNVPNNTYAIYNRENPDGWKWFHHDNEHTLGVSNSETNMVTPFTWAGAQWRYFNPHWLHEQLAASNANYRMAFADRVYRHFSNGGLLTPAASIARIQKRAQQIDLAIIAESARWGDAKRSQPYTKQDWQNEVNRIVNNYLPTRTQVVLNQFKSVGWYPNIDPPRFNQQGGYVATGFSLQMSASGGAVYYTLDGSDPRRPPRAAGSTSTTTLVAEAAPKKVLVPTGGIDDAWKGSRSFDDDMWIPVTGSPGGVGYERSTGYENYISLDLGAQMYGNYTSCYIRIPFTLETPPGELNMMWLNMRYDDGFVAYLNGVEIQRAEAPSVPAWNSAATAAGEASEVQTFDVAAHLNLLKRGENVLAIHGLNTSTTSSDFLISASLEAGRSDAPGGGNTSAEAIRYSGPVTLSESTHVKARLLSGDTWSALNEAVFAVGPVAESLRISELMYHPADAGNPNDPNTEYIELTNIGGQTINLSLVSFTNGVDFRFPSFELAPGDCCLVAKDVIALEAKYGPGLYIAGQYAGSLNNAGERIELQDAAGQIIHSFRFRDGWYDITDGMGFSLTVKNPFTATPEALSDKSDWRPSANIGGSPGFDDSGDVPVLGTVVINEVLANSAGAAPDWIELHNTTNQTIHIGGWFLSDDADNLTKYRIAEGTGVAGGGYLVFYEDRHFANEDDPGCNRAFALSRNGETVYLHSGSDGVLGGYSEQEKFDASDLGVSLGRHRKSAGTYNFVALSEPTPGRENAYPQVGPIVINEIMYHPDDPADAEYVELLNISDASVTLYDAARNAPWRFTDDPDNPGVELLFPIDQPPVLAPGEYLVVTKDLNALNAKYSVPAGVKGFAWGTGNLANDSEKIQLSKPGDEEPDGTRHWIRVDRVVYSDGSHHSDAPNGLDSWPLAADGYGSSLSRIDPAAYGNDRDNWHSGTPTPGGPNR